MNLVKSIRPLLTILGIDNGQQTAVSITRPQAITAPPRPAHVVKATAVPQRTAAQVRNLARRQLTFLTDEHTSSVTTLEVCGRIALVEFYPMRRVILAPIPAKDPTVPVPLVDLRPYPSHNKAYKKFCRLLEILEDSRKMKFWEEMEIKRHGGWVKLAAKKANEIIEASKTFLSPAEWDYYAAQLHECVANPTRDRVKRHFKQNYNFKGGEYDQIED